MMPASLQEFAVHPISTEARAYLSIEKVFYY
jgi:hypothetical protein